MAQKSGRNVKTKGGGRWGGDGGALTAPEMLDEHFPTLGGGRNSQHSGILAEQLPSINYQKLKQKTNPESQGPTKKVTSQEENFPSLGAAASSLSNFRPTYSVPTYRNITGLYACKKISHR